MKCYLSSDFHLVVLVLLSDFVSQLFFSIIINRHSASRKFTIIGNCSLLEGKKTVGARKNIQSIMVSIQSLSA